MTALLPCGSGARAAKSELLDASNAEVSSHVLRSQDKKLLQPALQPGGRVSRFAARLSRFGGMAARFKRPSAARAVPC